LDLSGNQLTSVPKELGNLAALEQLAIGGNQLTSVPAAFGRLTALKRLYLGDNQELTSVPAVGPGAFCSPHQRTQFNSRNEGRKMWMMTWRAKAAMP